jgi:hypothetical protein
MDEIVITVALDEDNGGYSFHVYDGCGAYERQEDADGGLCTSTMANAVDMAAEQAKDLLLRRP